MGRPVVRLPAHPRVGPLDETTVKVERKPPIATASGKTMQLHVIPLGRNA